MAFGVTNRTGDRNHGIRPGFAKLDMVSSGRVTEQIPGIILQRIELGATPMPDNIKGADGLQSPMYGTSKIPAGQRNK